MSFRGESATTDLMTGHVAGQRLAHHFVATRHPKTMSAEVTLDPSDHRRPGRKTKEMLRPDPSISPFDLLGTFCASIGNSRPDAFSPSSPTQTKCAKSSSVLLTMVTGFRLVSDSATPIVKVPEEESLVLEVAACETTPQPESTRTRQQISGRRIGGRVVRHPPLRILETPHLALVGIHLAQA